MMFNHDANTPIAMFSFTHFLMLGFLLVSTGVLYLFKDRFNPKTDKLFRRTLALLMLVLEITFWIWSFNGSSFSLLEMIPLGLCAMTLWLMIITLLLDLPALASILLPWSFVGVILSYVVVDMPFAFPHFRFFHYFLNHLLFFIGALYYLWVRKIAYPYQKLLKSIITLLVIATFIFVFNLVFKTNHMFLRNLPEGMKESFDFIPFPFTTIGLVIMIFIMIHLFYLLFIVIPKRKAISN